MYDVLHGYMFYFVVCKSCHIVAGFFLTIKRDFFVESRVGGMYSGRKSSNVFFVSENAQMRVHICS